MKRIRFTGTMACSLIQAPFIRLDRSWEQEKNGTFSTGNNVRAGGSICGSAFMSRSPAENTERVRIYQSFWQRLRLIAQS